MSDRITRALTGKPTRSGETEESAGVGEGRPDLQDEHVQGL